MENVVVKGAPGMRDWIGVQIPGLVVDAVDQRGDLTVVVHEDGSKGGYPYVVPVSTVHPLPADEIARIRNARLYRTEWSVKTGRSEREVYIPEAIRPRTVKEY